MHISGYGQLNKPNHWDMVKFLLCKIFIWINNDKNNKHYYDDQYNGFCFFQCLLCICINTEIKKLRNIFVSRKITRCEEQISKNKMVPFAYLPP